MPEQFAGNERAELIFVCSAFNQEQETREQAGVISKIILAEPFRFSY